MHDDNPSVSPRATNGVRIGATFTSHCDADGSAWRSVIPTCSTRSGVSKRPGYGSTEMEDGITGPAAVKPPTVGDREKEIMGTHTAVMQRDTPRRRVLPLDD